MGRMTRVRLSVRALQQSQSSGWNEEISSYVHTRYQFFNLYPVRGMMQGRENRATHDADFQAIGRKRPAVPDSARLVREDVNGNDVVAFQVVKVMARARTQQILLKEISEVQS